MIMVYFKLKLEKKALCMFSPSLLPQMFVVAYFLIEKRGLEKKILFPSVGEGAL